MQDPGDGVRPLPALRPGPTARTSAPVAGRLLDPPDVDTPLVRRLVDEHTRVAWGWRWWERFRDGRGTLAAKGIAYYAFFGLLSGLVLTYAVLVGTSSTLLALVDQTLTQALPGLIGPGGLDPERLERTAGRVGVLSAVVLAYTSLGVVRAVDEAVRMVYGVQFDPRGVVRKNLRHAGHVAMLLPLAVLSYAGTAAAAGLFEQALDQAGLDGRLAAALLVVGGIAVALPTNFVLVFLVLSRLTGVVPPLRARVVAAMAGAVGFEVFKIASALIIGFALDNPRYLGFGVPLALLLVFFLLATLLLAAAALAAVLTEDDPVALARRRQEQVP